MKKRISPSRIKTGDSRVTEIVSDLSQKINQLEQRLSIVEQDNIRLTQENIGLRIKVGELTEENEQLKKENKSLTQQLKASQQEVRKLSDRLHKKNSRNSSLPPSKDEDRQAKNKSLRGKSNKKRGGQKGHKGSFLKMFRNVENVEKHIPENCEACGRKLTADPIFKQRRQIIDIPPIKADVVEHQIYRRDCDCGHCTVAPFPHYVKAPISYGPNIMSIIAYLNVRQYIPYGRLTEFFKEMLHVDISAGTIRNQLSAAAKQLLPNYEWIRKQVAQSPVIGSDETNCKINTDLGWFWTWQTDELTYLRYSDNRGCKTLDDVFPGGLPDSIIVHDCYNTQFAMTCKGHQMCIPHLLRELNYFIDKGDQWSVDFKKQLKSALQLHKKIITKAINAPKGSITRINKKIDKLLTQEIRDIPNLAAFKDRMINKRDSLLRFLEDPSVPPDNNGSERAIRNIKIKSKISGLFHTENTAQDFAVIRSIIDTLIKRQQPVLSSLFSRF